MGLEAATTINELVEANPPGSDNRSQGDDHIRLIKGTLKRTFPNVTNVVTSTHTQLNSIAQPGVLCFPGMIVMWSGTIETIPTGWKLCNGVGTISNTNPVPDLRSKFIVGAIANSGSAYNIGQTGGAAEHTHTLTIAGHALTVDQIPGHTHTKTYSATVGGALNLGFVYNNANLYQAGGDSATGANGTFVTNSTGGGQAHTHTATAANASNIPPYFALAFIIKD